MSRRQPGPPPQLDGFEFIRSLGTGGFADVHLFRQLRPRREVAIKVLDAAQADAASIDAFTNEANHMAQVDHPAIVPIYGTDVARDGRPYIVMQYFPAGTLADRIARERLSEGQVLAIGVAVAGAVETAHRAGILHRDIKPANILVRGDDRVALTDFGIAVADGAVAEGVSVPWAPPEALGDPPRADARSDVYSLAATLYTLLARRPPFQVPEGRNTATDLVARTLSAPVPPLGRSDVSPELESVLHRSMAKDPGGRPSTALEFARLLQLVQIHADLRETPHGVVDDAVVDVGPDRGDDPDATRFRAVTSIDPDRDTTRPQPSRDSAPIAAATTTARRPETGSIRDVPARAVRVPAAVSAPAAPPVGDTLRRPAAPAPSIGAAPPEPRRRRWIPLAAGAAALAAAAAVAASVLLTPPPATPSATASAAPLDYGDEETVPGVTDLVGVSGTEGVVFTWSDPDPQAGDSYLWRPVVTGEDFAYQATDQPTATVIPGADGRACIDVLLVRADGRSASAGAEGCGP